MTEMTITTLYFYICIIHSLRVSLSILFVCFRWTYISSQLTTAAIIYRCCLETRKIYIVFSDNQYNSTYSKQLGVTEMH